MTDDPAQEMREIIPKLQDAYHDVLARLAQQGFPEPHLVTDTSGRYLVLDALTALVQARAALMDWGRP